MKKLWTVFFAFSLPVAHASSYYGVVQGIRVSASRAGAAQVAVRTTGNTACKTPGWYSFEDSKVGPGNAWLAGLLTARTIQEQIGIEGTGVCGPTGMEGVAAIDLGDTGSPALAPGAGDAPGKTSNESDKVASNNRPIRQVDFNNNGQTIDALVGDRIEITLGIIGPQSYGDPQISSAAVAYRGAALKGIPNPGGPTYIYIFNATTEGKARITFPINNAISAEAIKHYAFSITVEVRKP